MASSRSSRAGQGRPPPLPEAPRGCSSAGSATGGRKPRCRRPQGRRTGPGWWRGLAAVNVPDEAAWRAGRPGRILMTPTQQYLDEATQILRTPRYQRHRSRAGMPRLCSRERGGRLFFLGVGGSAANASHAVNDFRKIAGIEAYAPTDNVSELTARTNDEGWPSDLRRSGSAASAGSRPTTWSSYSRSAAATWRRTSARTWSVPSSMPRRSAPRSCGIVGKRRRLHGEGRRRLRHRADGQPRPSSRRTPRRSRRVVWHLLVSHPRLKAVGDQVGVNGLILRIGETYSRREDRRPGYVAAGLEAALGCTTRPLDQGL